MSHIRLRSQDMIVKALSVSGPIEQPIQMLLGATRGRQFLAARECSRAAERRLHRRGVPAWPECTRQMHAMTSSGIKAKEVP